MRLLGFALGLLTNVVVIGYYVLLIVTLPFLVLGLFLVTTVNLLAGTWDHLENAEFFKDSIKEHLEPFWNRDC